MRVTRGEGMEAMEEVTTVSRSWKARRLASAQSRPAVGRSPVSMEIPLFAQNGICVASRVRTAASFASRCIGLLNRRYLPDDEGLLLRPGGSIHTLGMRFGIDVLFLDDEMRILKIVRRLRPWRLAIAPRGTSSVLEIASGRAATALLVCGMRVTTKNVTGSGGTLSSLQNL